MGLPPLTPVGLQVLLVLDPPAEGREEEDPVDDLEVEDPMGDHEEKDPVDGHEEEDLPK